MACKKSQNKQLIKIYFFVSFTCFTFKLLISHKSQNGYGCNDNHTNHNSNDEAQIWRFRCTFTVSKKFYMRNYYERVSFSYIKYLADIFSRMNLPQFWICSQLIRVGLFLKTNLIYKIHDFRWSYSIICSSFLYTNNLLL